MEQYKLIELRETYRNPLTIKKVKVIPKYFCNALKRWGIKCPEKFNVCLRLSFRDKKNRKAIEAIDQIGKSSLLLKDKNNYF